MSIEKARAKDISIIVWFLRPYWRQAILVFSLLLVYALLDTISVGALYPFISRILAAGQAASPYTGRFLDLIDTFSSLIPLQDKLVSASLFLLVAVVLSHILGVIAESLSLWYHLRLYADLQNRIYKKMLFNHYSFFHEKKQGELMYIGREASLAVGETFFYFPKAGIEFFRIAIITILLVSISLKYTLLAYVVITLFGLLVYVLSNRVVNPASQKAQVAYSNITSLFSESIAGIRQIKILNNYERWLKSFFSETELARRLQFRYVAPSYLPSHLILSLGTILTILTIIYVKVRMPGQFLDLIPIIVVYVGAVMRLMPSLSSLSQHWMGLRGLAPRLRITYETLVDKSYDVRDGGRDFPGLKEEIRLANVSFSYATRDAVLSNISLTLPKGTTAAVVGESGSGKSTLADLMVRLYTPSSGTILVDDCDYTDFTLDSWLEHVGMVSQDTFMFHTSIKENIGAGRAGATEEKIRIAARIANADGFIEELPEGYDTIVGDRGVKLSGGQRQRIAIARALVRNPGVLVLDEATSALDTISERAVHEALKAARQSLTTLIIAHRLSTVEHADTIFVMDNGRIAEKGTHEELLARGGLYFRLYEKQKDKEMSTNGL